MAINANAGRRVICVALLALVLGTRRAAAAAEEDPEVTLCKLQCRRQQQFDERDKEQCVHACEEYGKMKEEIKRRGEGEPAHRVERLEKSLEQCKHECRVSQQISEDRRRRCERRCEEKYEEERKKAPHQAAQRKEGGGIVKPTMRRRRWRSSRKQMAAG